MKSILTILIAFVSFGVFAQAKPATSAKPVGGSCFREWYTLFKERGSNPVPDGTQDVVITLRNGEYSECFMGKIDIADGKIVGKLQIQKMDGSYEEFNKHVSSAYQNSEGILKDEQRYISNGMSSSVALQDGELIVLFFYKSLAEKTKANKKAPAPSSLVKN